MTKIKTNKHLTLPYKNYLQNLSPKTTHIPLRKIRKGHRQQNPPEIQKSGVPFDHLFLFKLDKFLLVPISFAFMLCCHILLNAKIDISLVPKRYGVVFQVNSVSYRQLCLMVVNHFLHFIVQLILKNTVLAWFLLSRNHLVVLFFIKGFNFLNPMWPLHGGWIADVPVVNFEKLEEEASLNSLPSKSLLDIPVFVHFEVPFDKKCSW